MKVIRANIMGFCMGVRRAVNTVQHVLADSCEKNVCTLGPLIHNPVVLSELEQEGVRILSETDLATVDKNSIVVIRAHGISPSTLKRLQDEGATVIDGTCPRVKTSQRRVLEYSQKGYTIFFTGDRNHGEVVGMAGFAINNFVLLQNIKEAHEYIENLLTTPKMSVLLSQTTFSLSDFTKIASILKKRIPNMEIFDTICPATKERQDSLRRLANLCQGILVVGGKTSANTRRLFEAAKSLCSTSMLIERDTEIPDMFYKLNTVGITAGSSTPDSVIDSVEKTLLQGIISR